MTGRKLAATVFVVDAAGLNVSFGPADDVPGWAAEQITNPKAWADVAAVDEHEAAEPADTPAAGGTPEKPRKNGSLEAWRAYAEALGFDVPDDATRDDIVAAVDEHEAAEPAES